MRLSLSLFSLALNNAFRLQRRVVGGGEKALAGLKTQRRKLAAGSGYLPRVESAAVISDNEMQNLTKLFVC
jgi:hypothetical protein